MAKNDAGTRRRGDAAKTVVAAEARVEETGWNHIDELENRDVRLISTQSRTGGQATR